MKREPPVNIQWFFGGKSSDWSRISSRFRWGLCGVFDVPREGGCTFLTANCHNFTRRWLKSCTNSVGSMSHRRDFRVIFQSDGRHLMESWRGGSLRCRYTRVKVNEDAVVSCRLTNRLTSQDEFTRHIQTQLSTTQINQQHPTTFQWIKFLKFQLEFHFTNSNQVDHFNSNCPILLNS